MSARSLLLVQPKPCEVCATRERVQISAPGAPETVVVPCLACAWGLPVISLPMRGDR